MATESGIELDDYRQQLFRGDTPSIALRDFIFQTFSIIDFISPTITGLIQQKNVDIDDENSAQISTVAKSMVTHDDPKL